MTLTPLTPAEQNNIQDLKTEFSEHRVETTLTL
jgi:hypothetical protein